MSADPPASVLSQLGSEIAGLRARGPRLSQRDLHGRMDAIRVTAAKHGLIALEGLAHLSARRALLPGHRTALSPCLDQMEAALDSRSGRDCTTLLAALAVRLH